MEDYIIQICPGRYLYRYNGFYSTTSHLTETVSFKSFESADNMLVRIEQAEYRPNGMDIWDWAQSTAQELFNLKSMCKDACVKKRIMEIKNVEDE